ncbi:MAG: adenine deaminase [Planctomycetes bacterium]|nr:adenine deaminase [Planctomycetota bacterium]
MPASNSGRTAGDVSVLERRIRVALGQEPGDLVLTGGRVVNVFTCQVEPANVVIADGWIAGVGPFDWQARETIQLDGRSVLPGLVDAHMHLESTLLMPAELARVVVPHGTTAIVSDPHEVGNVLGVRGIELLLAASECLPLDQYFMAPSCVPATSWEDAGAVLGATEVQELLGRQRVLGLAEVMDFPAVLRGERGLLEKVGAALRHNRAVDGHAPGMTGQTLVAYAAAGIRSDHESSTAEEALAKASLGWLVQVREGSSARNLDTLLPLMAADRLGDWCLATDDILPNDLVRDGHLDGLLRRVVAGGVSPAQAVRHTTLIPSRHYGLANRGAVAPAYHADLVVVDDLRSFGVRIVIKDGRIVARQGRCVADLRPPPTSYENTIRVGPLDESDFELRLTRDPCPVIAIVPDQIVTRYEEQPVPRENGRWLFDSDRDLLLIASIERHRATGRVGLGLVRGFGLRKHGALGSSVGHDSHNLVVAGTNPRDMLVCVRALTETGGGFVAVAGAEVLARLPLPVAGLLSTDPVDSVCRQLQDVEQAARSLGCPLNAPFGTLSFLALSVIPELRITDQGLFDVRTQQFLRL